MAAPELVIADAPYKVFPGGIIAIRCSDWLGPARGTLSTESDLLSVCGTVVRDIQQVSASVYLSEVGSNITANTQAEDTLVIPLNDLPLESNGSHPLLRYAILLSVKMEGTWNPDDVEGTSGTGSASDQHKLRGGAACTLHGLAAVPDDTDFLRLNFKPHNTDQYIITAWGGNWVIAENDDGETLHIRAYSQVGTTFEWLLDQIYFIPSQFQPFSPNGEWTNDDLKIIPGQISTFSGTYSLDPVFDPGNWFAAFVDGVDGGNGDGLGKFTWEPIIWDEPTDISGADGGGDYQKDDFEYFAKVHNTEDGEFGDFYWLSNSTKWPQYPDVEAAAYCYGLHGPLIHPNKTFTDFPCGDDIGDEYALGSYGDPEDTLVGGVTPTSGGYVWKSANPGQPLAIGPRDWTSGGFGNHRHAQSLWCTGQEINWVSKNSGDGDDGIWRSTGLALIPEHADGPGISLNNGLIRAIVKSEQLETYGGGSFNGPYPNGGVGFTIFSHWNPIGVSEQSAWFALTVNFDFGEWWIETTGQGLLSPGGAFHGPIAVAGGLAIGDEAGVRIDVSRFRLRIRVWNNTAGGEGGTWDFEDFYPLYRDAAPHNYDYDDNLEYTTLGSIARLQPEFAFFSATHGDVGVVKMTLDQFKVEYDPLGDPDSAWASIEQPAEGGTEIGRIEMPAGCQHLVYWGKRDWTTFVTDDGPYIEFAAKAWNDPGAAALQRSECVWWWFRSVHGGPIDLSKIRFRSFQRGDLNG